MENLTTNLTSVSLNIPNELIGFLDIKFIKGIFMIVGGILTMCDSVGELFLYVTTFILSDILHLGVPPIWIPGLINLVLLVGVGYLSLGISKKLIKYSALLLTSLVIISIIANIFGG